MRAMYLATLVVNPEAPCLAEEWCPNKEKSGFLRFRFSSAGAFGADH